MNSKRAQIRFKAIELLRANSEGIRYLELARLLREQFPDTPVGTINGSIWNLDKSTTNQVYKPARGLFRHVNFKDEKIITQLQDALKASENAEIKVKGEKITEEAFYEPFADYLVGELNECTKAVRLGGSRFKNKWGTPDVIGKRASDPSDIIKRETEIVTAEIKITDTDLVTAFGQACAYKLFSHKVYLVIPRNSREEEIDRVKALCLIFGIGLVIFDSGNPENPDFEIKVTAAKHEPDMFYLNENIKEVKKELFS